MIPYAHQPSAEDPESVPVRDAATVMIVADRPKLEVLMVRRTPRATFGPGAWVFPGGRVDRSDAAAAAAVTTGLSDIEASTRLGVERDGLAWWYASLRETTEEAGLLVGAHNANDEAISRVRQAVFDDADALAAALLAEGLRLDLSDINDVARFITPVGPPRRFDTWFFLAQAPEGQEAAPDEEEVIDHRWITPADAMAASQAGEFPLMSVTYRMIACLGRYTSAADVLAIARQRPDPQRVRVNDPEGAYDVVLPGDPGYETADVEIEHGWVRV